MSIPPDTETIRYAYREYVFWEDGKDSEAAFDTWLNERLAYAWDEGKAAEKRDWEFTWDLVTPDEDREPWTNPYREKE